MNGLVNQLAACFLLLQMLVTLIPLDVFHQHEEEHHCDGTDIALESNLCHVSIYHAESEEHQCEHNTHLTETHDECDLCKFIATKRHHYTADRFATLTPAIVSLDLTITEDFFLLRNSSGAVLGRAPPIS